MVFNNEDLTHFKPSIPYFCSMSENENNQPKGKQSDILKKLNIKKKKAPKERAEFDTSQPKEAPKLSPNGDSERFELVATCMQNLENELANELEELGAQKIDIQKRAVSFEADLPLLYKANIWLRTALKVLKPLFHFKAKTDDQLYAQAKKLKWEEIFTEDKTFSIDFAVHSEYFTHSQFAALRLKDAIVDYFREIGRDRPSVERDQPDVRIHLHINDNNITISLDSSGEPLFKRGYRRERLAAPINECLAAGLILKTGWKGEQDFLDPMCGSGTIAIEAALIASNIPPNLNRTHFAFESWMNYDPALLSQVLGEASNFFRPLKCKIFARDANSQAIRSTRVNINAANMRKSIDLEREDFFKAPAPSTKGIIVMNPPYGERLNVSGDLVSFYEKIGSTLKHEYSGWSAWVITSELDSFKNIGLKASQKIPMMNGKLECQFREYELFDGKLKEMKAGE